MKIISAPDPDIPDYKDLVSEADWIKYFKDKQYAYNDPLQLALLRTLEKLLKKKDEEVNDEKNGI